MKVIEIFAEHNTSLAGFKSGWIIGGGHRLTNNASQIQINNYLPGGLHYDLQGNIFECTHAKGDFNHSVM